MSDFLLWASVSASTRDRYRTALRDFRDWLITSDQPFNPNDPRSIDTALIEFAHQLFLCNPSRGNRQIIINARCALNIIYPITVHQLTGTDRALRGWNRLRPATSKAPVSYGFTLLLANTLLSRGEVEAGLFCIIAFDSFCRANELLKLVRDDVTLPAGEMPGGLRLRDTKTGRNQSVTAGSVCVPAPHGESQRTKCTFIHDLIRKIARSLERDTAENGGPTQQDCHPSLLSTRRRFLLVHEVYAHARYYHTRAMGLGQISQDLYPGRSCPYLRLSLTGQVTRALPSPRVQAYGSHGGFSRTQALNARASAPALFMLTHHQSLALYFCAYGVVGYLPGSVLQASLRVYGFAPTTALAQISPAAPSIFY